VFSLSFRDVELLLAEHITAFERVAIPENKPPDPRPLA
jgi:hypothetical protein